MTYQSKPLPFSEIPKGLSKKAVDIHHDKLYVGYVNKMNEIGEKLQALSETAFSGANQTYSELRALKDGETFATNGVYLHEAYFDVLSGAGQAQGPLVEALKETYGSLEKFVTIFSAVAMSVRGWVVLAWDTNIGQLKIYGADAHNQGGVWGCLPIIVLDVYEHAYFMDYGSDRGTYIKDFWASLNWPAANEKFGKIK